MFSVLEVFDSSVVLVVFCQRLLGTGTPSLPGARPRGPATSVPCKQVWFCYDHVGCDDGVCLMCELQGSVHFQLVCVCWGVAKGTRTLSSGAAVLCPFCLVVLSDSVSSSCYVGDSRVGVGSVACFATLFCADMPPIWWSKQQSTVRCKGGWCCSCDCNKVHAFSPALNLYI